MTKRKAEGIEEVDRWAVMGYIQREERVENLFELQIALAKKLHETLTPKTYFKFKHKYKGKAIWTDIYGVVTKVNGESASILEHYPKKGSKWSGVHLNKLEPCSGIPKMKTKPKIRYYLMRYEWLESEDNKRVRYVRTYESDYIPPDLVAMNKDVKSQVYAEITASSKTKAEKKMKKKLDAIDIGRTLLQEEASMIG